MYLLGLGILLLALKYLEFGPVAEWSWWIVLSPFAAAVAWWTWADWSGYTKRKAVERENARKQALSDEMSLITDEAPACFLWTINMLWGMTKNIDFAPRPDMRVFANDIHVR